MRLEAMGDKIMRSDRNILSVIMSYRTESYFKEQKGYKSLLTKAEIEKSLGNAALRWVNRRSLRKLGKPIYAMAKYEKVKRITMPFGRYGMILCTVRPESNTDIITTKLTKIIKNSNY